MRSVLAAALLLGAIAPASSAAAAPPGPGLGNVAFPASDVMKPIGVIQSPEGHGNVAMVQGYLMVIYSSDGGGSPDDGGIEFWDVSNPRAPTLAVRHDDVRTHGLREAHGFSLAWVPGPNGDRLLLAAQGIIGIQLWDVTDPFAIDLVSELDLPDIDRGDYSGDWWLFWQAPWLYVAGADAGLFVVDASVPENPVLVNRVSTGQLADVSPAQVFALGNLLVVMEAQNRGLATLDASNPAEPRLLRRFDGKAGYSHLFAADGKIYTSGNIPPRASVHQVSPEGNISFVSTFALYLDSGGYGTVQDGLFFSGFSDDVVKLDPATQTEVAKGSSGLSGRDEDFATVLGNLVVGGNDHGQGSAIFPHQTGPDTTAPVVQWMHPADGADDAALTTRVGLSFSDTIEPASLTPDTVKLLDADGAAIPAVLSAQFGLVNVAPTAPLLRNATYRVVVEGVKDLAGNPSPRFEGTVTTGDGAVSLDPASVVSGLDSNGLFGEPALVQFGTGVATYLDRDFAFVDGYPARFDRQPYIQTRNNDKLAVSADFLRFTLALESDVVVLYDTRAQSFPDWLDGFTATGETVANDDATYDVLVKRFLAGPVSLGGNNASGAEGAESMYGVIVVPVPLACTLELEPVLAGEVPLHVGVPAGASIEWAVGDQIVADAGADLDVTLPAGRHGVVVTVTKGPQVAVCSGVQIVHLPLVSEPGRSSGGLLVHDGFAIGTNEDNGTVTSVNVATGAVRWESAVGEEPVGVALSAAGELIVLDRASTSGAAALFVLDTTTGAERARRALPRAARPGGVVVSPSGDVYVSLHATGEVLRLDASFSVVARKPAVPTASGLTWFNDTLYVSRFISPDEAGQIVVMDAETLDVTGTIALAFDAGPDTEASGRGVPNYLSPLRISPDGTRGFVSGKKDNVARGLFKDGRALTFESRVRAFVSTIDLATHEEILPARLDINDRDMVQATALSPLGDLIFVASQGGNVVDVFDTRTGKRTTQFQVGKTPRDIAVTASGTVVVRNLLSRAQSFFDGSALLSGAGNHVALVRDVVTVADERLTPEVLLGKQVFFFAGDRRMSKDGYISCASCHLDGDHDGRTWDFTQAGEGLRNTIPLHGRAGTGHGNVHWTANFDEIQDFENDMRNGFGGTGFLSADDWALTQDPLGAPKAGRSAELDALAAYVATFDKVHPSPFRADDGTLTDAARRGREIFVEAACASCHAGARFTDGVRHDVGTASEGSGQGIGAPLAGIGFETPTLKGVWDSAPYLHDGSSPTLDDALVRHGDIPALDDAQRADLTAYLLALDESSLAPEAECAGPPNECVIVDDPNDPDPNVPNAPNQPPPDGGERAQGCGCGSSSTGDLGLGALLLVAIGRRRRRTPR